MPRPSMEAIRRRELIAATVEAIHASGIDGVTMGGIARRAGVSPALAHHYFGSKDELLIATMGHLLSDFAGEIRRRLRAAAGPAARARAVVAASFAPEQFRPAAISAWLAFYIQAIHDPAAARLMSIYLKRLESNLRHDLKALMAAEAAARTARGLAALIDGLWLRAALPGAHMSPQEAAMLAGGYLDAALANAGIGES